MQTQDLRPHKNDVHAKLIEADDYDLERNCRIMKTGLMMPDFKSFVGCNHRMQMEAEFFLDPAYLRNNDYG